MSKLRIVYRLSRKGQLAAIKAGLPAGAGQSLHLGDVPDWVIESPWAEVSPEGVITVDLGSVKIVQRFRVVLPDLDELRSWSPKQRVGTLSGGGYYGPPAPPNSEPRVVLDLPRGGHEFDNVLTLAEVAAWLEVQADELAISKHNAMGAVEEVLPVWRRARQQYDEAQAEAEKEREQWRKDQGRAAKEAHDAKFEAAAAWIEKSGSRRLRLCVETRQSEIVLWDLYTQERLKVELPGWELSPPRINRLETVNEPPLYALEHLAEVRKDDPQAELMLLQTGCDDYERCQSDCFTHWHDYAVVSQFLDRTIYIRCRGPIRGREKAIDSAKTVCELEEIGAEVLQRLGWGPAKTFNAAARACNDDQRQEAQLLCQLSGVIGRIEDEER